MSYEGYSQLLCKHGHCWEKNCYEIDEYARQLCPFGHPAVWENMVNTTNGSFEGNERIDGYIELEQIKERVCKHCGSVLETRYRIPKQRKKRQ